MYKYLTKKNLRNDSISSLEGIFYVQFAYKYLTKKRRKVTSKKHIPTSSY